jgi:hypothetical protein
MHAEDAEVAQKTQKRKRSLLLKITHPMMLNDDVFQEIHAFIAVFLIFGIFCAFCVNSASFASGICFQNFTSTHPPAEAKQSSFPAHPHTP